MFYKRTLVSISYNKMYRSIGHTSTVDESLFGKGDSGRMTKGRRTVTGPLAASSVVVTMDELNRIKVMKDYCLD